MSRLFHQRRLFRDRRGTTAVETALVLPVFLLFVMGLIELAHAQLIKNVLRGACREAARMGTTEGSSTAAVRERALQILESVVDEDEVEVFVKDASVYDEGGTPPDSGAALEALADIDLANAEPRQLFLVRARIDYVNVAIIPNIPYLGNFLADVVLEGQAFMRHE